jgi:hypothetical protein
MRDAFRRLSVTPEPDSERPTLHGDTDRPIGHRTTTRRPQLAPMVHRGALVVALPIDPPSADASRPFTRHPAMGPLANDGPSRFPVTLGQAPTDRVLPEHRPVFDELLVALLEDPQRARRVLRHGSVGLIWDRVQLVRPRLECVRYRADQIVGPVLHMAGTVVPVQGRLPTVVCRGHGAVGHIICHDMHDRKRHYLLQLG